MCSHHTQKLTISTLAVKLCVSHLLPPGDCHTWFHGCYVYIFISEVKSWECDICGSHFTAETSLIRHKRKHTGEAPYSCDNCCQNFARSDQLKQHVKKGECGTGEEPGTEGEAAGDSWSSKESQGENTPQEVSFLCRRNLSRSDQLNSTS